MGYLLVEPIVSLKEHTWNGVWQHQDNMYQLSGHWHKGEGARVFGERSFTVRQWDVRETCEFGKTTTTTVFDYQGLKSIILPFKWLCTTSATSKLSGARGQAKHGNVPWKNEKWRANSKLHTSRTLELTNYHSSLQGLLPHNKCTHLWFWITGRENT